MEIESDLSRHLTLVQEGADRAKHQVALAREHLEVAQRTQAFWDDLYSALRAGYCAQGLFFLRRDADLLHSLEAAEASTVQQLRELHRELQKRTQPAVGRIAREFPKAAREAGIDIDTTSRHPSYTFNQGFLRLDMDERKYTARISPRDGADIVVGLDLALVVGTVCSEQARIFDREVDSVAFLGSLHTAYLAVLRAENRPEGEEVPLRRVTNRLAKNLNRFAADEFNVDLSRLVQRGDLVVDGRRVHLNHTRDRRQGMLLHGLESGGYVGFISFKKEK